MYNEPKEWQRWIFIHCHCLIMLFILIPTLQSLQKIRAVNMEMAPERHVHISYSIPLFVKNYCL